MPNDLEKFDSLKAEVQVFVAPAMNVRVTDARSSQEAIHALKTVKHLMLQLEKKRVEIVKPLNDQVKAVNSFAKGIEDPLARAERHLKSEVARFEAELEARREAARREEQRRLEEEERKARVEQARIQAEIEEKRQAELEALKDTAQVASKAAAFFGEDESTADQADERRRIEEQAERERAEAAIRLEREEKQREIAAKDRAWEIEQQRTKNARKVWKCEAVDLSQVPRHFLKVELNTQAVLAAARGGTTAIPGVRLWQETAIAVGAHTYIPDALLEEKD